MLSDEMFTEVWHRIEAEIRITPQPMLVGPDPTVALFREALERGRWRAQDLRWCNKPDDCHLKAEGAELVLADIEDFLAHPPSVLSRLGERKP